MNTRAKDILKAAGIAIDAIDVIGGLVGIGDARAIAAIKAIVKAVKDGLAGKTTPDITAAELEKIANEFVDQLAKDDASIDKLIDTMPNSSDPG